jgi:uncharacterized coiled-coil protein SlyX
LLVKTPTLNFEQERAVTHGLEERLATVEKRLEEQQDTLNELLHMRLQVAGLEIRMVRVENHLTKQSLLLERSLAIGERTESMMSQLDKRVAHFLDVVEGKIP